MTSDAPSPGSRDDEAAQIAASLETLRRRRRDGLDRVAIATALLSALDGGSSESIRLATASAAHGTAFAATSGTLAALISEFDDLETLLIDQMAQRNSDSAPASPSELVATTRKLHTNAALARQAATAAFGHAVSAAARKRARMARHDIANAIGTVRNAILLMEDEAGESAREHFRAIAKRNSQSSEMLVRSHLSDRTALTAALGWDDLSISEVAGARERGANSSQLFTNVAALETVLDAIRAAQGTVAEGGGDPLQLSFVADSATAGVMTVKVSACDDREIDSSTRAALRDLAAAVGLRIEDDSESCAIRLLIPVSARDERHDLGGTSERHHADAIGF
jgi:hypothetical protein